jgi:hypothetical protein
MLYPLSYGGVRGGRCTRGAATGADGRASVARPGRYGRPLSGMAARVPHHFSTAAVAVLVGPPGPRIERRCVMRTMRTRVRPYSSTYLATRQGLQGATRSADRR